MKTITAFRTNAATMLSLIAAVWWVLSPLTRAADPTNPPPHRNLIPPSVGPATGQPIDPATGLPLPPPPPGWIDPNWKEPAKMVAEISYDGLPISEVSRHLRQEFKNEFDVLLPSGWQDSSSNVSIDPQSASVKMELRNVRASEIFNAMNMLFETENSPYRWELKMNGNRPTAMLRVLPQLLHVPEPPVQRPTERMVYFVGDLVDDSTGMERLVKTISEVYRMSYGDAKGIIQFHKEAQLIIVTGTIDQIKFVQQTLGALRGKITADRHAARTGEPKVKPDENRFQ